MCKITTLTFTGADGRKYKFSVYPKNTRFKALPAVYSFLSFGQDGRYHVLYIGQTTDLSTRFDDHHKWEEATRYGFEFIGVCTAVSFLSLDVDEANLIRAYRPRCNEVVPQ